MAKRSIEPWTRISMNYRRMRAIKPGIRSAWLNPTELLYYFLYVARQNWLEIACLFKWRSQHHTQAKMRKVYVKLLERWCELINEAEAKP
jgi:hypothetical protein